MATTKPPRVTIDFETRSEADIKTVGSWKYSQDPSTRPLCLAYKIPGGPEEPRLWHPAYPEFGIPESPLPEDLFQWIREGGIVEAHNAFFEQGIWENIMVPKHGWPEVRQSQWRCSAAKAGACALPRSLDQACKAMKLPGHLQKDDEGKKLMLKLAKPRRHLKADKKQPDYDPNKALWAGEWPDFLRLFEYCRQDVIAEEALSEALPDLSPFEQQVWCMDQRINKRGFYIDREAVDAALWIVDQVCGAMTAELVELTGGLVDRASKRAKLLEWFQGEGLPIADTQGATVDKFLAQENLPPHVYRVLQICKAVNRTSTAKYEAMHDYCAADSRAHGQFLYWGASTGRWAGMGIQPHNFPRGAIKDMGLAWEIIKSRDLELMALLYDDAMELLSHACRGAIAAPPGRRLIAADYSAIESRVIFWLAGEESALAVFRRGDCIYCDMAGGIYKRKIIKGVDNDERQLGKQAILGLGFGMGAPKFVDTCAKYDIVLELEFGKFVVDTYRTKYPRVKKYWYDVEAAAISAVRSPGKIFTVGQGKSAVMFKYEGRFLWCRLPSGRKLAYCDPLIIDKPVPWGGMKPALTFMAVDPMTKQWRRQDTYGGTLVENIVQATARDLMACAIVRAEQGGVYDVIGTVHDELISEADEDKGSVKEFEHLISVLPDWAEGCPVSAEGWAGPRYRK